jgi:hypothetical protein
MHGINIDYILCPERIREKLETKHRVSASEARETLLDRPRLRFAEGHVEGEDVARDMTRRERRSYGRR